MNWDEKSKEQRQCEKDSGNEPENEASLLFEAFRNNDIAQAEQIINKGSHIHPLVANSLLGTAILRGSPEMITLCLKIGAKLGIQHFEDAMRASSSIQKFLSKYAPETFNSTDWRQYSPSIKLARYFLSLKLFSPQWAKKLSSKTIDSMLLDIPNPLNDEPFLDNLLNYLIARDNIILLHDNVKKWGVQLTQLQKSPVIYATSFHMMSYLERRGCFDVKLPNNKNLLHQLFSNESQFNEKAYSLIIHLSPDLFAQDDQGNTPLHIFAVKHPLDTKFVKNATNGFTDVRFYTLLNSLKESISTLYKPHNNYEEMLLPLYRFYEKIMNSQGSQQEPWIGTFQVNILKFCKKLFSSCTVDTMEALVAYAATINYEMVKPILLEKKVSVLNQNIGNGYTLLMHCAEHKSLSVCQELIQWGADPFLVTKDNTTVFKSIPTTDKLHYFMSLGVKPTFEDIKSMKPKIQAELFNYPNMYQTIVQAVAIYQSLLLPLLSEVVTRSISFKPFEICKIEEWLKKTSQSQLVELFSSNCRYENSQITQSFVNVVPIDTLSRAKVTNVKDERIMTILLQEGIPFEYNIHEQTIVTLLRFRPHYILRFGQSLEKNILTCFLSFFKRGNYSHLPYNFMEKKVLCRRDIIIVTHDFNTGLKKDCISCNIQAEEINTNNEEYEANVEYDSNYRRSNYSSSTPQIAKENKRERFEGDRAPPMSSLVAQLQVMIRDLRERNAEQLSTQEKYTYRRHYRQELDEHERRFINFGKHLHFCDAR